MDRPWSVDDPNARAARAEQCEMHAVFGSSAGTPGFVATLIGDPGLTAAVAGSWA